MDTSEQYIRMCDCEEVQGAYEPDMTSAFLTKSFWGNRGSRILWLPRQDQLQRMIRIYQEKTDDYVDAYELAEDFNIFLNKMSYNHESMEQLWLAFVMYELHGKKWDGEKWTVNSMANKGGGACAVLEGNRTDLQSSKSTSAKVGGSHAKSSASDKIAISNWWRLSGTIKG